MKITLTKPYKSLRPFSSEDLSKLTIITGKNGSGKTQLLKLLENYLKDNQNTTNDFLIIDHDIKLIQSEGIIKQENTRIENGNWKSIVSSRLREFKEFTLEEIELRQYVIDNNITQVGDTKGDKLLSSNPDYIKLLKKAESASKRRGHPSPMYTIDERTILFQNNILNVLFNSQSKKVFEFADEVCLHTCKQMTEISETDFYTAPVNESMFDENYLFNSVIESIFYNYANRRHLNEQASFYKERRGIENNSLTDKEFSTKYPEPWLLINNIFKKNNIEFYFEGAEHSKFHPEILLDFKLCKKTTNELIMFNELSSGEQMIIGLIIKLFTSEYYKDNLKFPDLLLLDEPDAHLHPEMSKLLIDILDNTFSKEFGIKVIVTTHSPSTVALAPEGSIYQLTNGANTSLKKISKDDALTMLTAGLILVTPTTRYILVEGKDDQPFYKSLYRKLLDDKIIPTTPSLGFVKGTGSGSVVQMSNWYKGLSEAGFGEKIKGIIDRDKGNSTAEGIFVLDRYSIENYLLDPFLVIFNAKKIPDAVASFDIKEPEEYKIMKMNQQELQVLCDVVFKEIESLGDPITSDNKLLSINYINGYILNYPTWFIREKGKSLLGLFQKKFGSALNSSSLTITLIRVGLIPTDLINLFLNLQK